VTPLVHKLFRDLARLKGPAISIGLVVCCGVAMFVAAVSCYGSLVANRSDYYAKQRFADVFATLERAPRTLAARIAEIPGVAAVEPRIVEDVTLDLPDLPEPSSARLISLPKGARRSSTDCTSARDGCSNQAAPTRCSWMHRSRPPTSSLPVIALPRS
jgi:putative ABC transport system permease protein